MIHQVHNTPSFIRACPGLSDDVLRRSAPSVFAVAPQPGVSERYAFVPTAQIVARLREVGWVPVSASEQRVRLDERRGKEPDPAVDVETHAARRDDACVEAERGNPPDGKPVSPVDVRHGKRIFYDAGQGGDIGQLLEGARFKNPGKGL